MPRKPRISIPMESEIFMTVYLAKATKGMTLVIRIKMSIGIAFRTILLFERVFIGLAIRNWTVS